MSLSPSSHHGLGPSKFPAFAECAAFESAPEEEIDDIDAAQLAAEAGAPLPADMSAKARGTAKHEALAKLLSVDDKVRTTWRAGLFPAEEPQVEWVANQVLELAAANGYGPHEIKTEVRVTLLDGGFKPIYFGTMDGEFGPIIFDAKYGNERNYFPQLAGYALAKMERDESARCIAYTIYGFWRRVKKDIITKDTAERVVYGILGRRMDPNRKETPCSYCGWCQKPPRCKALGAHPEALTLAREDWLLKWDNAHTSQLATDPARMGLARYVWKTFIEPWGKHVEYASSNMAAGGIVPLGYKRSVSKGSAGFTDAQAAISALKGAGIPAELVSEAVSTSFGALVSVVQKAFGGSEELAKAKTEQILTAAGCFARGEPVAMLRKVSDAESLLRAALAGPQSPNTAMAITAAPAVIDVEAKAP